MSRFEDFVHPILHRPRRPVDFNFDHIVLLEPISLLALLWVFPTVAARVAHGIARNEGIFLVFLFGVVDHTDHDVSVKCLANLHFETLCLIGIDRVIQDIVGPSGAGILDDGFILYLEIGCVSLL